VKGSRASTANGQMSQLLDSVTDLRDCRLVFGRILGSILPRAWLDTAVCRRDGV
jgi:hypothetical protein